MTKRTKAKRMLDSHWVARGALKVVTDNVRGTGFAVQPAPYHVAMGDSLDLLQPRVVQQGSAMGKTTSLVGLMHAPGLPVVPVLQSGYGDGLAWWAGEVRGAEVKARTYAEFVRLALAHVADGLDLRYVVDASTGDVTYDAPDCPAWVGALRARDRIAAWVAPHE